MNATYLFVLFVMVQAQGKGVVSVNIARGKPAAQSTTGYYGRASRAVDGNTNTHYVKNSCTHTKYQEGAWWRVDLRDQFYVNMVKITNRGDCCWSRLRNFEVRVGNNKMNPKANQWCAAVFRAMGRGETRTIQCASRRQGRYVFVINKVKEVLTLCEVQVFGEKGMASNNIARGKPTAQSSTAWYGRPSRAVDGNTNTNYMHNSCTHTREQQGAWWKVDLGDQFDVSQVKITNRGDCCWGRLKNFEVRVGDNNMMPKANQLCTAVDGSMGKGETRPLECATRPKGRYVFVVNNVKEVLTLCEVQVFGQKASVKPKPPPIPGTVKPKPPPIPGTVKPKPPPIPGTVKPKPPPIPGTVKPKRPPIPGTVKPKRPPIPGTVKPKRPPIPE